MGARGLATQDFEVLRFPIAFLAKKVVFLVSRRKNEISPLLYPLQMFLVTFEKINYWHPPEKYLSDAHAHEYTRRPCTRVHPTPMHTGTPDAHAHGYTELN